MSTERSKVVIITGAGSGIGRASTLALLARGHKVALFGRRRDALEETVRLHLGAPANGTQARAADEERARTLIVSGDVTLEEDVQTLFEEAKKMWGRIDVLFNNAGVSLPNIPIDQLSLSHWCQVVDINLTGSFLCAREAVRHMKTQAPAGGRIINNGSVSAYVPRPNSTPYTSTKHAIRGLTLSLALDGRPHGILVSQIDIGNAASSMGSRMARGVPQADGTVRAEPVMNVERAADMVVHLVELPSEVDVPFVQVLAAGMPSFVGRG